jgi:glucose/arabinose dehydrogenase
MSSRICISFLGVLTLAAVPARAAVTDLRITEVDSLGDWVEVTHFSDVGFTNGSTRAFCHRSNYTQSILAGVTFGARESKTFNVTLHDTLSEVWLYIGTSFFETPANMITGMKYGGSAIVGREGVAVTAGLWPSTSTFVPLPEPGETMQLIGDDPAVASNWKSLPPTPDEFFTISDPFPNIPQSTTAIGLRVVASGFVSPLGVRSPGDGSGRLFVFDQAGMIHILQDGLLLGTPFADLSSQLVTLSTGFDERGLLGLAFHPQFSSNGKLYTYTSEPNSGTADFPVSGSQNHMAVITEWQISPTNANLIDLSSERELLRIDQPQRNHNGGDIAFDSDGNLSIAVGDGGSSNDSARGHGPLGNSQDPLNALGAILRIDVDGTNSVNGKYGIPGTNPFITDTNVLNEIYAYGFRNPYRISFDSISGDFYVGDVGQREIEELDLVLPGGNYGWRVKEGSYFFNPVTAAISGAPVDPVPPNLIDPIAEYDHDDGVSIIGGYVYHGTAIPSLANRYVFGEFGGPSRRLLVLNAEGNIERLTIGNNNRGHGFNVKGFGQDDEGEIYVCGSTQTGPIGTTGVVLKIIPLLGLLNIEVAGADAVLNVVRDSSVGGVAVEANSDPANPGGWAPRAAGVVSLQPGLDEATVTRSGDDETYRVRGP